MEHFIKDLIDEQVDLYKRNSNRMIADYNIENQQVRDYNGRQLLELIQNADDEGADTVLLELDSSSRTLKISNNGQCAFSKAGYESLMLPNLSSKTKERYIGNKGLGFRSIINWSDSIVVRSNLIDVTFSKRFATQMFEETFNESEKNRIRVKQGLSKNEAPWAVLALPELSQAPESVWTTQIIINYRIEFEDNILKQLRSLKKETLLFLNNLTCLEVLINGEPLNYTATKDGDDFEVSGDCWKVYDSGKLLLPEELQDPSKNEKQHYNLKIALPKFRLESQSQKLYSFFPTKINLDFPFLIHGTFDLDSSRNQLNDTRKNRYVLERLVQLIVDVAKDVAGSGVSWEPYGILTYQSKNTVLEDLSFYSQIDKAKAEMEIYPCVDGNYRKVGDYIYMGDNNFAQLLLSTEGESFFPQVLLPLHEDLPNQVEQFSIFESDDHLVNINNYSHHLTQYPLNKRIDLICEVLAWKVSLKQFNLLVNKSNELINGDDEDVFTPLTSNIGDILFPSYVKIEFINQNLANGLIARLNISAKEKYRDLQRELKKVTNIRSYEPAELIVKIVRSTNKAIEKNQAKSKEFIGEMTLCLFLIYQQLGESRARFPVNVQINLLNRKGHLKRASELHLSKGYPTGNVVEQIFGEVYSDEYFLADVGELELASEELVEVEEFFLWLGVNSFAAYQPITYDADYIQHITKSNNVTARGLPKLDVLGISHELFKSIIAICTTEQIVLWILNDPVIRSRIQSKGLDKARYELKGEVSGTYKHTYPEVTPYFVFLFNYYGCFNHFWLSDDSVSDVFNDKPLDYGLLYNHGFSKPEVDSILLKLGAKDNFNNLPIEHISSSLRKLPELYPEGNNTQKIYKLVLGHFRINGHPIKNDVKLFAKTTSQEMYWEQEQIFYTDNIKLPTKIIEDKPILNFPKRSGSKQVSECFNVKNLNDIKLDITKYVEAKNLSDEFDKKFQRIKPYLLSYRFEKIQASQKAQDTKLLADKTIVLCSLVECICENEKISLSENDYILDQAKGIYYIKVDSNRGLDKILKDSSFGDTFAEIICSIFSVNENRSDFRNVLRDDEPDIEHQIRNEMGSELLEEVRKFLGISDRFVSFWTSIFLIKSIEPTFEICRANTSLISESLSIDINKIQSINYEQYDFDCIKKVLNLFRELTIQVSQFNKHAAYKLFLSEWHANELSRVARSYLKQFKYLLWQKTSHSKSIDEAQRFIGILNKYENIESWVEPVAISKTEIADLKYDELIKALLISEFGISLGPVPESNLNEPEELFQENIRALNISNYADLPQEARSLLYFDSFQDIIKSYLTEDEDQIDIEGAYSPNVSISDVPDSTSKTNVVA